MRLLSNGNTFRDKEFLKQKRSVDSPDSAVARYQNHSYFMIVSGDDYENGYAQGQLLRLQIRNGVYKYFERPSQSIGVKTNSRLIEWLITLILDLFIFGPLEKNCTTRFRKELKGIADGAGISYRKLFRANSISELKMCAMGKALKGFFQVNSLAECSTAVIGQSFSNSGGGLIARNTDYAGGNYWCKNQLVIRYANPGLYKYVSVTAAGILKCNSAINEHGLFVGGHFLGLQGATANGTPFSCIEHEIMAKCSTLEKAVEVVRQYTFAGSFALVIADKSGRSLLIECVANSLFIKEQDAELFFMANHAQTDEGQSLDILKKSRIFHDNISGRMIRAQSIFRDWQKPFTPESLSSLLGDRYDEAASHERSNAGTIGFKDNVTSIVVDTKSGNLWIASGEAPVCDNIYYGYDFELNKTNHNIYPYPWIEADKRNTLRQYLELQDASIDLPHQKLRNIALTLISKDPQEPKYFFLLTKIFLQVNNLEEALITISSSIDICNTNNELAYALTLKSSIELKANFIEEHRKTNLQLSYLLKKGINILLAKEAHKTLLSRPVSKSMQDLYDERFF
ncbi:C45 family autoproteolytic acyltransferase/hydolase [Ectopseudomonas oleovorans]|uniref:C45 family autoproteolytic acyltransferase/hydolase n=1 Tax=Ectopseudomonas oleovorans TaxID=301 RepID=UPI00244710EE|nr:C45 family peptidase [Pseudomonas oleovorans]MDH2201646.1 C45 family peptidase [Pseudomonas oleovorans]